MAYAQHKGFVPVRKKGKRPCETISREYDLEYGQATIEMHKDAIRPGQKVIIVDDLIATGGTTEAIVKLIEQLGGQVVKICFVMELAGLKGREHLKGCLLYTSNPLHPADSGRNHALVNISELVLNVAPTIQIRGYTMINPTRISRV